MTLPKYASLKQFICKWLNIRHFTHKNHE